MAINTKILWSSMDNVGSANYGKHGVSNLMAVSVDLASRWQASVVNLEQA